MTNEIKAMTIGLKIKCDTCLREVECIKLENGALYYPSAWHRLGDQVFRCGGCAFVNQAIRHIPGGK